MSTHPTETLLNRGQKNTLNENVRSAFESCVQHLAANLHFAFAVLSHCLGSQESIENLLRDYESRVTEAAREIDRQKNNVEGSTGAAANGLLRSGTRTWQKTSLAEQLDQPRVRRWDEAERSRLAQEQQQREQCVPRLMQRAPKCGPWRNEGEAVPRVAA